MRAAFSMIGGAAFQAELLDETGTIVAAQSDRAHGFSVERQQHTTASDIHATTVNGVTLGLWLGFMLAGTRADWIQRSNAAAAPTPALLR